MKTPAHGLQSAAAHYADHDHELTAIEQIIQI